MVNIAAEFLRPNDFFKLIFRSLEVFLNGEAEKSRSHVSVFLNLVESASAQFTIKFKFEILGKTDKDTCVSKQDERMVEEFKDNNGYGWTKFMSHDELFNPEKQFIRNGILTVICEVNILNYFVTAGRLIPLNFFS